VKRLGLLVVFSGAYLATKVYLSSVPSGHTFFVRLTFHYLKLRMLAALLTADPKASAAR
jgi:hypothetical protein